MEDCKKRARVDSESDPVSPELKRVDTKADLWFDSERVDLEWYAERQAAELGRVWFDSGVDAAVDAGFNLGSPETRQFRDEIFDILDDSDTLPEIQGLDSFIKSFEEEILHPAPTSEEKTNLGLTSSDSGESPPVLGYLLEASDDELGLPPSVSSPENQGSKDAVNFPADASVLDNLMGFEDDLPSYDSFELTIPGATTGAGEDYGGNNGGEFVTVDGLFDYAEPAEFSEFSWRPESLPAL